VSTCHVLGMTYRFNFLFVYYVIFFYFYFIVLLSTTFVIYSVSKKNPPPLKFSDIFPKRFGIFSPNFVRLLYVHIYAGLQIFIQLPATLTKLCHNKRDHHNVLKMSIIDRKARWVVALNMAKLCQSWR